jgi:hypothetical protein
LVTVRHHPDPHRLDGDRDGIACESQGEAGETTSENEGRRRVQLARTPPTKVAKRG